MTTDLRWGILGTGRIAQTFVKQLPASNTGKLVAVGTRDPSQAPHWCSVPMMHYASVIADPNVDAVYIALPNGLHKEWTLRALHEGKHVLCEKPLACSVADVEEMFAHAKAHRRLLVEAFMYRCQPAVQDALRMIHEGAIGEVHTMRGAFAFSDVLHPHDYRWHEDHGPGALMDVGCYPVQLMNAIMKAEPLRVEASLCEAKPDVDRSGAALLHYPGGVPGVITFGMEIGDDRSFHVSGTRGSIRFNDPWLSGTEFIWQHDGDTETHRHESPLGQYALEADAFAAALRGEAPPWISETESLWCARTIASIKKAGRRA